MQLQKLHILFLGYKLFEGFEESFSYDQNSTLKFIEKFVILRRYATFGRSLLHTPLAEVYKFKK